MLKAGRGRGQRPNDGVKGRSQGAVGDESNRCLEPCDVFAMVEENIAQGLCEGEIMMPCD